jgi:Baseplate J-like protein
MQTVDEQPETIHLYVVREAAPKPSLLPIVLSVLALSLIVAIVVLAPYQQPVTRAVIRVPAVPLAVKTFTAQTPVIPTGIKTYPATTAHGVLTITNGSIIAQVIPAGFTISNVATDYAIYVPAGNANGYGYATVRAHALVHGKGGNFARLAINQVIGSSVYVRNLAAFQGGRDAYSVKFITSNDRNVAFSKIRDMLTSKITSLHYPCQEIVKNRTSMVNLIVTWRCQFVSYSVPSYMHVTRIKIIGKNLLLDVWFVVRPSRIWVK